MDQIAQKTHWPAYSLVYGLIAVSGMEYFYRSQEYVILLFLAACVIAFIQKTVFTVRPLIIILVVCLLEQLQAVQFDNFVPVSMISILLRLAVVYLVVHICGLKTIKWYINILYLSALISLPIYFLTFFPSAEQFLIQNVARVFFNPLFSVEEGMYRASPNILVYNFNPFAVDMVGPFLVKRNSGPFWEPGAFAVMINIALVLNIIRKKSLVNRRNVWLVIALVTTLSTAGYVTFFVIAVGYLLTNPAITEKTKAVYLLLFIPVALLFYSRMAFMEEKIEQNISLTQEDNTSRFGSAYLDLIDLAKSPLIGFGRLAENRFGQMARSQDMATHRNNGVTSLLITYGIPATLLYFTALFLFFWRYCQLSGFPMLFSGFAFLSVMLSGFSQVIFDRAIVLAFLFLAERLRQVNTRKPSIARQRAHLTNSRA